MPAAQVFICEEPDILYIRLLVCSWTLRSHFPMSTKALVAGPSHAQLESIQDAISNDAAMKGIKEFVADDRFRTTAKIVVLDPSDEAEKSFLNDLQVDTTTKTAVTVFLAPPGSPIAMYEGATSKSEFLGAIQKAGSCGPGGVCGPGGCGPQ